MAKTLSELLEDARLLPLVPLVGAHGYQKEVDSMAVMVDALLEKRDDIDILTGNNPRQVMHENHRHHAAFMATVFGVGAYELLARTIVWVYRTYHFHGFQYEYFPVELNGWKKAVAEHLDERHSSQILTIYDWMIENHESMVKLAETGKQEKTPVGENWLQIKNTFREKLIVGDYQSCRLIAKSYLENRETLIELYTQIIQPAMYEIGQLWESGNISVAQEHLASAVVSRIMASINGGKEISSHKKGIAVVTAAPGEFHELGAWMLSDILEQDGWSIFYLGANTPDVDLQRFMDEKRPEMLALSVTMPFNIARVKNLIESIRNNGLHAGVKILVGGRVFVDNPELERIVGADGFAANLDAALRITRSWV